jgi:hypothetical protein
VTEKTDLIAKLQAAEILNGIRWAYASAVSRTLADYSEDTGHDTAWLGNTRYILFRDRLDRVFSCEKYALQAGEDSAAGLDLVRIELTERDIKSMPSIDPGLVRRSDLNRSPGWFAEGLRFLIASADFGKIDALPWPRKSPTKQAVASQASPEPLPTLFDVLSEDEMAGLATLGDDTLDVETFVVAHSLDAVGHKQELVFGRPRLNEGGGDAWYWYENLLTSPTQPGGRQNAPQPTGPDSSPDAPVRLRKKSERSDEVAGGE